MSFFPLHLCLDISHKSLFLFHRLSSILFVQNIFRIFLTFLAKGFVSLKTFLPPLCVTYTSGIIQIYSDPTNSGYSARKTTRNMKSWNSWVGTSPLGSDDFLLIENVWRLSFAKINHHQKHFPIVTIHFARLISTDHKLSSPIFPCCLSRIATICNISTISPLYDVLDHTSMALIWNGIGLWVGEKYNQPKSK